MAWQDIAIGLAQLSFIISLIPAIRKHSTLPLATTSISVVAATTILIAVATLGLWIAATMSAIKTSMWVVLAVQSYRAEHR